VEEVIMRRVAISVGLLIAMLFPQGSSALDTEDILALVAMPLAVAAVSDIAGVPPRDVVAMVAALNQARVPPPQFVEVVRYSPVMLIEPAVQPEFRTVLTSQTSQRVRGDALAIALADRFRTYGATEIDVVNPPRIVVVERRFVPVVVEQQVSLRPLSLVAMPLAVAAASELAGVPPRELVQLTTALNEALVPPIHFIEVVRHAPAVLVDPAIQPEFLRFVRTQVDRDVRGDAFAIALTDRFRTYGLTEVDLVDARQRTVVLEREVIPEFVVRRVAQVSGHPHGGPPGQLKRDLGLQTGAEVVHGRHPGRGGPRLDRSTATPRPAPATRQRGPAPRPAPQATQPRPQRATEDGEARGRRDTPGRSQGSARRVTPPPSDDTAAPRGSSRPEEAGRSQGRGRPEQAGASQGRGRPEQAGRGQGGGRPDQAGAPAQNRGKGKQKGRDDR
jgi:hypothetical protein